jgi:hypothetical protein
MCCSQNPDCIHRDIRAATISNLSDGSFRMDDVLSGTHVFGKGDDCTLKDLQNDQKLQEINASDVYGNNTLFFAARSGASLDVLLALLGRTFNVNAVNSDGQTFLFLLDPHDASFSKCNCAASLAGYHSSGFECLIRKLEERTFNFDQIDHDGKNFLFCLCAAHTFNPDWLDRLVEHDRTWLGRIQSLAQVRDSSGSYLKDFLALNLKTSDVIETRWLELDSYKNSRLSTFLCSEEFLLGSTSLHEQVIRDVSNVMIPYSISTMVNQYNRFGRTPIMEFLEMALDRGIKETLVVAKLQELESLGAKINTRNRDGDTMLHIAAKRSCPEILEHLLFVGVQVDHRNNTGLTALDYAAQNVDRSRHIKVSPHAMASSFKSATRLLDYARLGFGRQKSSDKIAQKNLKAAEEAAKRSLESMTKLQNYRRPLTADRNPSL